MARLNQDGKDLDLRAAASQRYRQRQAAQREWLRDVASFLDIEPDKMIELSAASVAAAIRKG